MSIPDSKLLSVLSSQNDDSWAKIVAELQPSIHSVDRQATRIWFAFFPVKLFKALADSANPEETAKKLLLKGQYRLWDQVDSSAEFLYGHRFWPEVKREVADYAAEGGSNAPLAEQIREVARRTAAKIKANESILTGIAAVAFGTLQQVGLEIFKHPARSGDYGKNWKKSPDQVAADRAKDDNQGIFDFSIGRSKFTVTFREFEPGGSFRIVNLQDVTMAAKEDKREHHLKDQRCMAGRRSDSGRMPHGGLRDLLGRSSLADGKISPPNSREINKWPYFGYEGFTGDKDSPIRLACQMKAFGNVTIVIPPWNGMIGKLDEKEKTAAA